MPMMRFLSCSIAFILASQSLAQKCDTLQDDGACNTNSSCLWVDGVCIELIDDSNQSALCGQCLNDAGNFCQEAADCGVCDSNALNPGEICLADTDCKQKARSRSRSHNQPGKCVFSVCDAIPCPDSTPAPAATDFTGRKDNFDFLLSTCFQCSNDAKHSCQKAADCGVCDSNSLNPGNHCSANSDCKRQGRSRSRNRGRQGRCVFGRCNAVSCPKLTPSNPPVAPVVTSAPTTPKPTSTPVPTTARPTPVPTSAPVPTSNPVQPQSTPSPITSPPILAPITSIPTAAPTAATSVPTPAPATPKPTGAPTRFQPTPAPITPTNAPTISQPTNVPIPITPQPTDAPTTSRPTDAPITPEPTFAPTTFKPTDAPITPQPTPTPTFAPTTLKPIQAPITPQPTNNPTPGPATPLFTEPGVRFAFTVGDSETSFVKSTAGKLFKLSTEDGVPAGRSYDGHGWESVQPTLLEYACSESACSVKLAPGNYVLDAYDPQPLSTNHEASRLLMQTTFGPTETEMASVKDPGQWLSSQMSIKPSLHRVHYRNRANARLTQEIDTMGTRNSCSVGSRWNNYAFSRADIGSVITTISTANGNTALQINGVTRTELSSFAPAIGAPYVICNVVDYVDGDLVLGTEDGSPTKCTMATVVIGNPAVHFYGPSPPVVDAILKDITPKVLDTKVAVTFLGDCPNEFVRYGSLFYRHDKRIEILDLDDFQRHSVTKSCPSAPKTFLNQESCRVLAECSPPSWTFAEFQLNEATLAQYYSTSKLYVYRVNGLRILSTQKSPCAGGGNSLYRWTRRDSDNDSDGCPGGATNLEVSIKAALVNAIVPLLVKNPGALAIDVNHNENKCNDPSNTAIGARVSVPKMGCWTHSHPDEWSVYEFSSWVIAHPGNPEAFRKSKPNPIAKIAKQDAVTLNFPHWHEQSRWDSSRWFTLVGLWYGTVDFAALDPKVQETGMAKIVGSSQIGFSGSAEVCGSPGEVANLPSKGHHYNNYRYGDQADTSDISLDQDHSDRYGKTMVWATLALKSPDQLRQRVAWALSQIFVVTASDINREHTTEPWGAYHDIFVRNAFGSFRQILKEVSYNPMMGIMLTYLGSKSLARSVEESGAMNFPDENFAREIMQLFSIGVWKLNPDGTRVLDETGSPVPTYDNGDITTFARGWTGLDFPATRGNLESEWMPHSYKNYIDPMRILANDARDVFPKLSLDDNGRSYMGDGVQRCDTMPDKAFLKKGAMYRFLGHDSTSQLGRLDPSWWSKSEGLNPRLVLSPTTSALYNNLCKADEKGKCQFQSYVVLDQNLDCDGSCTAGEYAGHKAPAGTSCECDIDEPRVVRLEGSTATGSSKPTYYEYVRQPCVSMAFPDHPTYTVSEINAGGGALCADSRLPVAGTACCNANGVASSICVFQGERVSYSTAEKRCKDLGKVTCGWDSVRTNSNCGTDLTTWDGTNPKAGLWFTWTNSPCSVKAQISEQGDVAIIHDVQPLSKPVKGRVAMNSATYFRVIWEGDGSFPEAKSGCSGCKVVESSCLCDPVVSTSAVFTGPSFPSEANLVDRLHIGAPDPTSFGTDIYHRCQSSTCVSRKDSIIAYTKGSGPILLDSEISFDKDTIFELVNPKGGPPKYVMNIESVVSVGDGFQMRNPPMHNSIVDQTPRDAHYEMDAMLDKYVHHSNVAPFIATRLIQLLISSNPSHRYVSEVASAFTAGRYTAFSNNFGSGEYGDLGAAVAAIFLDREARSSTLDADSTNGRAREPLLKVMHLLRSMHLDSPEEREVNLRGLREKIGQEPHNAPSVFSFFQGDFSPVGPVFDKGLVSPESQILDAPKLVRFFNGLASLPLFGLSECEWGDGLGDTTERYKLVNHPEEGKFDCIANYDLEENGFSTPFRLDWVPSVWSAGFPPIDPADIAVSLTSAPYCGCRDCTEQVWSTYSYLTSGNNHTCGRRIKWVHDNPRLPNGTAACSDQAGIGKTFGNICGPACDPARCDIEKTSFQGFAADVIDELDTLLTGGRLVPENRAIMEAAYVDEAARRDIPAIVAHERALRKVQQLFALTPEFQITNKLMDESTPMRLREMTVETTPEIPPPVTGYKAIVYLFLDGAMDSFSALVPYAECGSTNLLQQYQDVRGDVAIPLNQLHQISASSQPCQKFGLHPSLSHLQQLYNSGDAAIIANIGPLVEPVTKKEYENDMKAVPPALFAHNTQQIVTQTVFAQDSTAGGVLGRIGDELNIQESLSKGEDVEIFDAYSISGTPKLLEGSPGVSRVADVLTGRGVAGLVPTARRIEATVRNLNAYVGDSIYGETFSEKVTSSLNRIELLGGTLKASSISNSACFDNLDTDIARQFKTVAQVIAARDTLEAKRDAFYTRHGGYDTHSDNGPRLTELLSEVNKAVACFTTELKSQGIWANVTIITASEFGRTLTSNGQGTDHAWGGNHFVFGGGVKGGQILGGFPDDLTDEGPLSIGRGRLIPTTSWEAVWNAVASWFGVSESRIDVVLPNKRNFPASDIIGLKQLFKD